MNATNLLLAGLITTVTGWFSWNRPVIEIPARIGFRMILAGFVLGITGAVLAGQVDARD